MMKADMFFHISRTIATIQYICRGQVPMTREVLFHLTWVLLVQDGFEEMRDHGRYKSSYRERMFTGEILAASAETFWKTEISR